MLIEELMLMVFLLTVLEVFALWKRLGLLNVFGVLLAVFGIAIFGNSTSMLTESGAVELSGTIVMLVFAVFAIIHAVTILANWMG